MSKVPRGKLNNYASKNPTSEILLSAEIRSWKLISVSSESSFHLSIKIRCVREWRFSELENLLVVEIAATCNRARSDLREGKISPSRDIDILAIEIPDEMAIRNDGTSAQ